MQPKVEEYLASAKTRLAKAQTAARDEILKGAGLVNREYEKGFHHISSPYKIYDSSTKTYYRDVPLKVTSEEFEAVRDIYNDLKEAEGKKSRNRIAILLKIIAVLIYVGGAVLGFILGNRTSGDFNFELALKYWAFALVSGSLVLGFGEIISLLQSGRSK